MPVRFAEGGLPEGLTTRGPAPRLDELVQPAAILTNCERVAALRSALAIHGVTMTRHHSEPNTPGEVAELEALARGHGGQGVL